MAFQMTPGIFRGILGLTLITGLLLIIWHRVDASRAIPVGVVQSMGFDTAVGAAIHNAVTLFRDEHSRSRIQPVQLDDAANPLMSVARVEEALVQGVRFFVAVHPSSCAVAILHFFAGPTALNIALDMLLGLEFLHASGHIHRDIKPANILLKKESDGIIKARIGDFGLARSFVGAGGTRLTKVVS